MTTLTPNQREPKELRPRAAVAGVIATLFFLALVARLYHLQVVRGPELSRKSRENFVKELVEPADRGLILDHRRRRLAESRPSFDVYLTPAFARNVEEIIGRLTTHLDLTPEETDAALKTAKGSRRLERFRPFLVKRDITRDQLDVLEADMAQLEGVDMIPSPHRYYPYGSLLAHVVGYMSEVSQAEFEANKPKYRRGDFIGRRGIEKALENELRGDDGRRRIAVDAKGRELDPEIASELIAEEHRRVPGRPGHNVVLSIDLGLQHIAETALSEAARAGAAVVMDVHTGFVLAMVSHPSYDPNKMTGRISRRDLEAIANDPLEPLFQRAVQQHYHPGSTFKIVTALAGLEAGLTVPATATSCNGGYTLGNRRWRCWKDSGHGGGINLKRSLQHSCDVYYYWIADKIGLDPIAEMAHRMGFGKPTGIELSPEAKGLIPTVEFHNRVDKGYTRGFALNASIGQGSVNVSPLQLANAYAALANGGTLYRPRLVRRVESAEGELVRQFLPEKIRDLDVKPAHLWAVMDGIVSVVEEPGGTAYIRRLEDVRVAGKTGTAQVAALGEKRLKESEMAWAARDHAWFAAVAPAEEPEIAVVVLNEHGGHGSSAAAPVAMAIIQGYFDLKKKEAENREPLSPQAIASMRPEARYAAKWLRNRAVEPPPPDPVRAPPRERRDPASSAAEVADPQMLRNRSEGTTTAIVGDGASP